MGGKSKSATVGYWYKVLFHAGLGAGPIDAFLEFRGGDKVAWQGVLNASGTISINRPNLWGGEKDQGGIVGAVDVMFGEPTQMPNEYLAANLGPQVPAWRGLATLVFKGGKYGAMNPYPQKASYKIRKITKGWDGDVCWYPEKAGILIPDAGSPVTVPGYFAVLEPTPGGTGLYLSDQIVQPMSGTVTQIAQAAVNARNAAYEMHGNPQRVWMVDARYNGTEVIAMGNANDHPPTDYIGVASVAADMVCPEFFTASCPDTQTVVCTLPSALIGMNPAHVLYYARTSGDIGREPIANMNDASYRAAADQLHAEGFGICTAYDPAAESLEEFEQRICKLIGGSVSRSLVDGQWYLDLARDNYVLEDLPILTDDDILEFSEQPSTLDGVINSLSVKYFDPERKEAVVTPPVQALALIDAFGTIHQANEYPEIPVGALALRVADRDLRATVTPTRAFDLITTRKTYAWRPGQYFRLQTPKRGIADMVCIVGEKQSGTLRSGAIKLKATQDIYSLPATTFVEIEPGVDTGPSPFPVPITVQRAIEAPYVLVVTFLSRADLEALPPDIGYLMSVADDPASSRDYSLTVAPPGGDYAFQGNGDWCPNGVVIEAAGYTETVFTLSAGIRVDQVAIGDLALWDDELCRVDAISTSSLTLGRGCGDTVPQKHAAASRIWFLGDHFAADPTEYTDAESVLVKLLTNTGTAQLDPNLATEMPVTFDQRQARPYPPAKFRVNGEADPASVIGTVTLTWAHRDRALQADQLVDTEAADVGPEPGTTYTVRWFVNDVLVHTDSAITLATASYTPSGGGLLRIEAESVRDGLSSWQAQVREVALGQPLQTESGDLITTEDNDPILME